MVLFQLHIDTHTHQNNIADCRAALALGVGNDLQPLCKLLPVTNGKQGLVKHRSIRQDGRQTISMALRMSSTSVSAAQALSGHGSPAS